MSALTRTLTYTTTDIDAGHTEGSVLKGTTLLSNRTGRTLAVSGLSSVSFLRPTTLQEASTSATAVITSVRPKGARLRRTCEEDRRRGAGRRCRVWVVPQGLPVSVPTRTCVGRETGIGVALTGSYKSVERLDTNKDSPSVPTPFPLPVSVGPPLQVED